MSALLSKVLIFLNCHSFCRLHLDTNSNLQETQGEVGLSRTSVSAEADCCTRKNNEQTLAVPDDKCAGATIDTTQTQLLTTSAEDVGYWEGGSTDLKEKQWTQECHDWHRSRCHSSRHHNRQSYELYRQRNSHKRKEMETRAVDATGDSVADSLSSLCVSNSNTPCSSVPSLVAMPRSCRAEATSSAMCLDDTTVDDLAGYLDQIMFLPKPMSEMAELMYT